MKLDLRFLSSLSLVAALGFGTGCPADDDTGDSGADTEDGSSGTTAPTTDPTTDPTDPTATTTDPTTGATEGTTTDPTEGSETTDPTGVDPLPDGSECMMDDQCESGHCYVAGALGGLCGECSSDADCDGGGCSLPNPLAEPPTGSTCNMGMLGDGCETGEVCAKGLDCVEIINVPGILTANTCSECTTTDDCTDGNVCNVAVDVANITGEKTCVVPGSVPDGEFCDIEGDGEEACENHCGEADLKGLLTFGVCGECRNVDGEPEGCMGNEVCVDPVVGLDGTITPAVCE